MEPNQGYFEPLLPGNTTPALGVPPSAGVSPEEQAACRRAVRFAGNKNGLLLLALLVFSNGVVMAAMLLLRQLAGVLPGGLYALLKSAVPFVSMYLIAIPILLRLNRFGGGEKPCFLKKPAMRGGEIAKWCVIGFGCAYAVNYVFNIFFLLLQAAGLKLHTPSMVMGNTPLDYAMTFVFLAVAAPLCEELFFRGALLSNLRTLGDWFAIVTIGVMFGLMHANYQQIFYAAAMGIFAGYTAVRAGSVLPAILMHFSLNAVGAVQSILLSRAGGAFAPEKLLELPNDELLRQAAPLLGIFALAFLCFGIMAAGVILFCIELAKRRERMKLTNGGAALSAGQKALCYFTAPGTLLFILSALAMTVRNAIGPAI